MNSPEINLIWATGGQKLVQQALGTGKVLLLIVASFKFFFS